MLKECYSEVQINVPLISLLVINLWCELNRVSHMCFHPQILLLSGFTLCYVIRYSFETRVILNNKTVKFLVFACLQKLCRQYVACIAHPSWYAYTKFGRHTWWALVTNPCEEWHVSK